MQTLGLIIALAIIVEGLVEYFGAPIPADYKRYVAMAAGVVLCLSYSADLLAAFGSVAISPLIGQALTGLLIGRGSNYINDLVGRMRVISAPAVAVDAIPEAPTASQVRRETMKQAAAQARDALAALDAPADEE